MADIVDVRVGGGVPDAIMFGSFATEKANGDLQLETIIEKDNSSIAENPEGTWEINSDWDVEFIDNGRTIKINKFKIDTWGIRHKVKSSSDASNKYKNIQCRIEGLTYVNQNVIKATAGSEEVTGFANAYTGNGGWIVEWYPGLQTSGNYVKGLVIQGQMVYTDGWNNARDCSYAMGRAPWEINGTRDRMVTDGIRPTGMMTGGGCSAFCIGLFGGVQNATAHNDNANGAYRVYDISEHPIYIHLDVPDMSKPVDPSSVECWDAWLGETKIYHKDRTYENCWKKYGIAKDVEYRSGEELTPYVVRQVDGAGADTGKHGLKIPEIVDMEDYISRIVDGKTYITTWNCKIGNMEFWDKVKAVYAERTIRPGVLWNDSGHTSGGNKLGLFQNSNIDGELVLNVNGWNDAGGESTLSAEDFLNKTGITKLTMNMDGCYMGSMHNAFRHANSLEEIVMVRKTGDKPCLCKDMSGAFEFCYKLKTIPGNLIHWNDRGIQVPSTGDDTVYASNMGYAFEYSGLESIPQVPDVERDSDKNTIRPSTVTQMFNQCGGLVSIGPVLDMRYVRPATSANSCFAGTWALKDVRIKNLNHGDWSFDGESRDGVYHGNLPGLDQASIAYLFANLTDLTTHDEASTDWANPDVSEACLYCPMEWTGVYDLSAKGTVQNEASAEKNVLRMTKRQTSGGSTSSWFSKSANTYLKFKVEGLAEGDVLGVGYGSLGGTVDQFTEDGTYEIEQLKMSSSNQWAFKLWNDDTGLTDEVTVTVIQVDEFTDRISSEMIALANAKGWSVYADGAELV